MAFTVQDDNGSVAGANAYIDVAFLDAYHLDRGNTVTGTTTEKEQAIVRATDYMDHRFRWVGERQSIDQRTGWPRIGAEDRDDDHRSGIPEEVKEACAEYALISLSATLNPTPTRDDTGRSMQSKSEKVGPISESVSFVSGGSFSMPKYPVADNKLRGAGLVVSGRIMRRA